MWERRLHRSMLWCEGNTIEGESIDGVEAVFGWERTGCGNPGRGPDGELETRGAPGESTAVGKPAAQGRLGVPAEPRGPGGTARWLCSWLSWELPRC